MENGIALVSALLYGKLDGLSPETLFLYARTGLLHLFSASGFHMGAALILARLGSKALGSLFPARGKRALAFILSLALMTFFGAQTEWSSPLVRAYAFTTLLSGAQVLEVRPSRLWVFTLSLLAAATFGKGSLLSFLLSAAGMAGVLFLGTNPLTLALGPWLFTLPLVIWHFHLVSLASPFWNLTLGVAISFTVLPLAILDLLLDAVGLRWPPIPQANARLMEYFHQALETGDQWIGGAYWVNPWLFFALAGFLALALFTNRHRARYFAASSAFLFALIAPLPKLAVLNVGQGDAIFLRNSQGDRILVDGGPPGGKKFPSPVNGSLEALGVGALDQILLTHADTDHWGGLPSLLARHPLRGALWVRRDTLPDPRLQPLLAAAERARVPVRLLRAGHNPAGLRCWLPPAVSANESSPLCHAPLLRGKSLWLTGDGGFAAENWLLRQGPIPTADFLKVGHHGSKHSSGGKFIAATGAHTALVSVGRKNRYGHPAKEALSRLEGMKVRRTDQEGSLVFY